MISGNSRDNVMNKLLTATILALFFSATAMAETTGLTLNHNDNDGGWVINKDQPNGGDRCGCPEEAFACDEVGGDDWPTRCLKENISPSDNIYGACYFNRAEGEWTIMRYPQVKVPTGYPDDLGGYSAGVNIPFPGWPAEAPKKDSRVSEWRGTLRKKYHARYIQDGGEAPGLIDHTYVKKVKKDEHLIAWGHAWQIHHILERKHNGTDTWGNMVPVHSRPPANHHSKFTTFWQRVRVDSQFRGTETWSKIENCSYTQWLTTEDQRQEIADW